MTELTTIKHQLTPQEIEVTNSLPENVKQYVTPRQEKPISQLSDYEVKKSCLDLITVSYAEMTPNGQVDHKILSFQSEALKLELTGKYTSLTLSELKTAFKRGIRGESGPYFGLCAKTYNQFLKWYFELPDRGAAWIAYMKLIEGAGTANKPMVLTKEYLKNVALTAFDEYKKNGSLPMVAHAIYDTIKELKGVETLIDKEDWIDIKEEAKKSYAMAMNVKKKDIASVLDFSMSNRSYEFHVKRIALRHYFDHLIMYKRGLDI